MERGMEVARVAGAQYLRGLGDVTEDPPIILDARIGRPCMEPTVLVIVGNDEARVEAFRAKARKIEQQAWDDHGVLVSIWTSRADGLDMDVVEIDFPEHLRAHELRV